MENVRNFVIMAHVDHGKSTLADRLLELTSAVEAKKMRPQFLDSMDLEQERGITIKMHPVKMQYKNYTLNLIDTPGHVDFNYEVSRSLAAVEGAVLLVDATKGIQAQTIGNLELARHQGLVIIPVINKIDMPQARIEETEREIADLLKIDPSEILRVSGKEGTNVEKVLEAVVAKVPPPKSSGGPSSATLRALIFDSKFDAFKGVIAFVRVFDGQIRKGDNIYLIQGKASSEVKEVGIFKPELSSVESLGSGEIGYIATGIKESGKVRVGDTITNLQPQDLNFQAIEVLPGYNEPQPKVFLSIYPGDSNNFELLKIGLEKLKLTDASLQFKPEFKESLGRGFQCGFLGLLHAEIVSERLKREYDLELVLSAPSVLYKITASDSKERFVYTSADWPESGVLSAQELWAKLQILTPLDYLGQAMELIKSIESKHQKTDYLGNKSELIYETPLREIITKNFYDKLKSATKGFASMGYEILDWRPANLVKLDILILGKKEEALSRIVPEREAYAEGKKIVEKLKENLPPQLYSVPLQASIGGKIIARETMRAKGKDVIAPLYGGDYTRKKKLLEIQKKGKKELRAKAQIRIPSQVFIEMLK
ncbi:MAG: elongation factor 4 [Candidatus Nealsonbacteria bacterium]|nr:elongation factor 4 [Candidatus Nealsonbacteria bacterium]